MQQATPARVKDLKPCDDVRLAGWSFTVALSRTRSSVTDCLVLFIVDVVLTDCDVVDACFLPDTTMKGAPLNRRFATRLHSYPLFYCCYVLGTFWS